MTKKLDDNSRLNIAISLFKRDPLNLAGNSANIGPTAIVALARKINAKPDLVLERHNMDGSRLIMNWETYQWEQIEAPSDIFPPGWDVGVSEEEIKQARADNFAQFKEERKQAKAAERARIREAKAALKKEEQQRLREEKAAERARIKEEKEAARREEKLAREKSKVPGERRASREKSSNGDSGNPTARGVHPEQDQPGLPAPVPGGDVSSGSGGAH